MAVFVKIGQRRANASAYGTRSLLEVHREHVGQACDPVLHCAVVDEAADAGDVDHDPTHEVDCEENVADKAGQTRGRGEKRSQEDDVCQARSLLHKQ